MSVETFMDGLGAARDAGRVSWDFYDQVTHLAWAVHEAQRIADALDDPDDGTFENLEDVRMACTATGIPHFHAHDLRHRYASVKIAEGVPVTDLAAQLGHSKKSLTLDTYSHVLVD